MIIIAHRILIGTAIVFGVFFALWEVVQYRQHGAVRDLVVAVIATLITAAMAYYLKHLRRFISS